MKYPFKTEYVCEGENRFWIAKSESIDGCLGQGDTIEEAIKELEENESEWIDSAEEFGLEIPELVAKKPSEFSGKISLRVSPFVHKKAYDMAKFGGISVNQLINDAIISYTSEVLGSSYVTNATKLQAAASSYIVNDSIVGTANAINSIFEKYQYNV